MSEAIQLALIAAIPTFIVALLTQIPTLLMAWAAYKQGKKAVSAVADNTVVNEAAKKASADRFEVTEKKLDNITDAQSNRIQSLESDLLDEKARTAGVIKEEMHAERMRAALNTKI
jgi:hypothetical protein